MGGLRTSIERIVYIATIVVTVGGWVGTLIIYKNAIDENTRQLEQLDKAVRRQNELNGRFMLYMELDNV